MNDQTQSSSQLQVFKGNLNSLIEKKELALPSNVTQEAFRNAAVVAVQDNPDLLSADQQSLFKSIRRAAASGLVPDGREGALVTFKTKDKASGQWVNKVQFMPMVFGLMKMARRSGTVKEIRAHIVYQKEVDQERFEYVVGDEERLRHEPILFGDRGEPVGAYAIATMKDGSVVREFMTADEIDTVRRAGSSQRVYQKGEKPKVSTSPIGIWKDWWAEMWKKTVIRRLTKRLDLSADDVRHIQEEAEFDGLRDVTPEPERVSSFAKKAMGIKPDDEAQPEQKAQEIEDAEIVDAETLEDTDLTPDAPAEGTDASDGASFTIEDINLDDAFPGSDEFNEGVDAFKAGKPMTACPYMDDREKATDWFGGWTGAKTAADE